jgi:hypothetical protein
VKHLVGPEALSEREEQRKDEKPEVMWLWEVMVRSGEVMRGYGEVVRGQVRL